MFQKSFFSSKCEQHHKTSLVFLLQHSMAFVLLQTKFTISLTTVDCLCEKDSIHIHPTTKQYHNTMDPSSSSIPVMRCPTDLMTKGPNGDNLAAAAIQTHPIDRMQRGKTNNLKNTFSFLLRVHQFMPCSKPFSKFLLFPKKQFTMPILSI